MPAGCQLLSSPRLRLAALAFLIASTVAACHPGPPPATVPMRSVRYERPGRPAGDRRCLIVFLHGRGDRPEDFARHGFLDRLRERRIDCDAVAVDSHLGYFADRTIGERIEEDAVAPAHAAGYREIWLVGISLGGLGALIHESEHPRRVAGMVLIAPYLGEGRPIAADDFVRRLWVFLRAAYGAPAPGGRPPTPIYLGLGRDDRYGAGQRQLAELLPPDRVTTVPGGHRWGVWETLWRRFLERGVLPAGSP